MASLADAGAGNFHYVENAANLSEIFSSELATARELVDAHEAAYWQGSLYASWTAALRTLSPRAARW